MFTLRQEKSTDDIRDELYLCNKQLYLPIFLKQGHQTNISTYKSWSNRQTNNRSTKVFDLYDLRNSYTIFAKKIFTHVLTNISGYTVLIFKKNWWPNLSPSNLQAIYTNCISPSQFVQKLFNFEWNCSISLLPFLNNPRVILFHYLMNYF